MKRENLRHLLLGLLISLLLAVSVYAVVRSTKSILNTFSPSEVSIAVVENDSEYTTPSAKTVDLVEDTVSDETVLSAKKVVSVKNVSPNSAQEVFVRVCLFSKFLNSELATDNKYQIFIPYEEFKETLSGNTFKQGDVTFVLADNWSTNWTYHNGYFYYKGGGNGGVLANGETTKTLLSSVYISKDRYKYYSDKGADLKVVVLADAIQSVGRAVENRWQGSGLSSNDKERPSDGEASTAIAAFLSAYSIDDEATSDSAVSAGSIVLSDYAMNRVLSMVTRVGVTVIYDYDESVEESADNDGGVSVSDSVESGAAAE